jgi:hypothetical protein
MTPVRRLERRLASAMLYRLSMILKTTDRRIPIRLLVRVDEEIGGVHRLGNYPMAVVGPAQESDWGEVWSEGDREAVVWVEARYMDIAMLELTSMTEIVDARGPTPLKTGTGPF